MLKVLTQLAYTLALVLGALSVRADELSDWQPIGSELFAAHKLSASSWNVAQQHTTYQKLKHDLEAYQAAYPHPQHGDGLPGLIVAVQRYVEALSWEQAAAPTPDDPGGMKSVILHLRALYQKGTIAEKTGNWQEACENYSACGNYWATLSELHPQWLPMYVAEQKSLCGERYLAIWVRLQKIQWQKNPYFDPKFHTPLSV